MGIGLGLGLGLGSTSIVSKGHNADEDELPRRYLFIDGAFLQRFLSETRDKLEPEFYSFDINFQILGRDYDRIFYYDAFPEKKSNQTAAEFEKLTTETEENFDRISRLDNFSVRPALTKGGRRQQQKGVDVLLAIECLLHAVRNNIDEATILTSDLDFLSFIRSAFANEDKISTSLSNRQNLSRTLACCRLLRTLDNGGLFGVARASSWQAPRGTQPDSQRSFEWRKGGRWLDRRKVIQAYSSLCGGN